jgi:hypothetical protein
MDTGAPKKITSPEHLLELFEGYKEWAKANPWCKKDFIRSGEFAGQVVDLPTEHPLTEWGFAAFCKISYQGLRNYGEREGYEEFFDTYARIKTEMTSQRVSGGLSGAYNANLVARIDGITEKHEIDQNINMNLADRLSQARQRVDEN